MVYIFSDGKICKEPSLYGNNLRGDVIELKMVSDHHCGNMFKLGTRVVFKGTQWRNHGSNQS
jgi:hypothetical protein